MSTNKRRVLSSIVAALCYIPFAFVMIMKLNYIYEAAGIFLPVLCVSTVIMYVPLERDHYVDFSKELKYNMGITLGFSAVMCLVGSIRELLASGTLLGYPVLENILVPDAAYPYVGFLLFGLICAVAQTIRNYVRKEDPEDE